MGLKRLEHKNARFYMHYAISANGEGEQALEAVVLAKNNSSTVKVTRDNNDLQRWCVKLRRSPEEYLAQLCEALVGEDCNMGVFEVQDEHLVWKQYFPDKDIYGKKGKFKMEKMEYDDAVELVLAGAMRDLQDSSHQVHSLTRETQENTRKLDEALELASKSVQIKEEFEKEIYSKCAALINAKKLRIHQLRSTHPSSSAGRSSYLTRAGEEVGTSTQPAKKLKKWEKEQEAGNNSNGYSSDTDVDDPNEEDMDTDEEKAISLSPVKANRERVKASISKLGQGERQGHVLSSNKAPNAADSQELFNASLEAELYPSTTTGVKQCAGTKASPVKPVSQSPPQLTRSKTAESVVSPTLPISNSDFDETQMSILNELF